MKRKTEQEKAAECAELEKKFVEYFAERYKGLVVTKTAFHFFAFISTDERTRYKWEHSFVAHCDKTKTARTWRNAIAFYVNGNVNG